MKNLMRVFSVMLFISMVLYIVTEINPNISGDLGEVVYKIEALTLVNIFPILSICLCCFCLERNDENYLTRLIPAYMFLSIILSTLLLTVFAEDYSAYLLKMTTEGTRYAEYVGEISINPLVSVMCWTYNLMTKTHLVFTVLSLLFIIKPNNQITTMIKKVTYIILIVNIGLALWISIKSYMEKTLPNVYSYDGYNIGGSGFNFSSINDTKSFAATVYNVSVLGEVFCILLLFTTNYAFSSSISYDVDEIDLYETKKKAEELANSKMEERYSKEEEKPETVIDRSQSENGLMNVSNQLGVDSNVGKVKESAQTSTVQKDEMKDLMQQQSQGPVINETVARKPLPNVENPVNQFKEEKVDTQPQEPVKEETKPETIVQKPGSSVKEEDIEVLED